MSPARRLPPAAPSNARSALARPPRPRRCDEPGLPTPTSTGRAPPGGRGGWRSPRALTGKLEVRRRAARVSAASHTLHAAQGYTTHRKLGGRFGRRGPAPTTLGAPAPPAAAPPAPPAPSRAVPTPGHHPRARGGPFGRVLGGPIFRLPLRFIGATAVGPSSEEAGASSGWVGALVFGGDTQSRRHRGAGCVRWLAPRGARRLSGSPAPGCGVAAAADPLARPGWRRAAGRHCLACECPHSHVSPGAPRLPAKCELPGAGKSPRGCRPASRLPGTPRFSLFSSLLLSIGAPREPRQGAPEGNGELVPSRLCTFLF